MKLYPFNNSPFPSPNHWQPPFYFLSPEYCFIFEIVPDYSITPIRRDFFLVCNSISVLNFTRAPTLPHSGILIYLVLFLAGHSKYPLPTTQEKTLHMDITRWSTPNQTDYILCSQRWRSSIQSAKTRPGADCGSDHELLIAKFRLKLKKVGKTTRPFRYDPNQIPYDYTVEVKNRFK